MPSRNRTTEEFIAHAKAKHGDKYDYSRVKYVNHKTKIRIVCPIHGEFLTTPLQHLVSKNGCPKCSGKMRKSTSEFIEESKAVWGDVLDYSKTVYVNAYTPVVLTCKIHGDFKTKPYNHLKGKFGCPQCTALSQSMRCRKSICDIATNDSENPETQTRVFQIWHGVIKRTCDAKTKSRHKGYENASICAEWLCFSAFKAWVESSESGYREGYELDKDILGDEKDLYSPQTCCFVHPRINKLLIHRRGRENGLPLGVSRCGDKFAAFCSHGDKIINLGSYPTPDEAFAAYKADKEAYIKHVAQEYYDKGEMHKRVYDALMRYEVKPSM